MAAEGLGVGGFGVVCVCGGWDKVLTRTLIYRPGSYKTIKAFMSHNARLSDSRDAR